MANDGRDVERFRRLYTDTINTADKLHLHYTKGANLTGYIKDRLKANEPYWNALVGNAPYDPEINMTVASGEVLIRSFNQQLKQICKQLPDQSAKLTTLTNSIETFDSTSASLTWAVSILKGNESNPQPCPFIEHEDNLSRAKRLEKLDYNLAETYRQVWETLHGTRSDPERGAMFLMRQTYDHFFGILAPDDKVRKSPVWKEKDGEKPDSVSRSERIEYAALTRIKDKELAKMLSASAKPILMVYKKLNQAHVRGELNPQNTRDTVLAMDKIISDWLDALGIIPD